MKYVSVPTTIFALLSMLLAHSNVSRAESWEQRESSPMVVNFDDGMATTTLSNGKTLPLVGVGLGSSEPSLVVPTIFHGLRDDKKIRLIDTAQSADNEGLIAAGILSGIDSMAGYNNEKLTVHVVTKVWYTHLGYARTKLAVKKTFNNFASVLADKRVDLKIHVLLHWPRCYDNVDWMDCEGEESSLDEEIRSAGPNPGLNPHSWKESWKALEDIYSTQEYPVESIGVSNFQITDLQEFELFAKIQPHMLQINMWSLFYDPTVIDYCQTHNILVQVFNVMGLVKDGAQTSPHAYHHLEKIASDLSTDQQKELTPAQAILAWLIQHGISVIPRTTNINRLHERLSENSAVTLTSIPELSDYQVETVAHAMESFLGGEDLEEDMNVMVTFEAKSRDLMLYWQRPDGSEVHVAYIPQGTTFNETTLPKHNYKVYDAQNKESFVEYRVQARFGEHETVPF